MPSGKEKPAEDAKAAKEDEKKKATEEPEEEWGDAPTRQMQAIPEDLVRKP